MKHGDCNYYRYHCCFKEQNYYCCPGLLGLSFVEKWPTGEVALRRLLAGLGPSLAGKPHGPQISSGPHSLQRLASGFPDNFCNSCTYIQPGQPCTQPLTRPRSTLVPYEGRSRGLGAPPLDQSPPYLSRRLGPGMPPCMMVGNLRIINISALLTLALWVSP